MHEYINGFKNYFVIEGRASRRDYWMFVLFNFLFFVLLIILSKIISIFSFGLGIITLLIPWFIYCFFIIIPSLTITIRRLHDINKSGWWYFISFIPIVGGIWLFVFLVTKGDSNENKYGLEPPIHTSSFKKISKEKIAKVFKIIIVVLFISFIVYVSIKSNHQKKVNEANRIMNEEKVNNVVLPTSFKIKITSKNSNDSASTESNGNLTFINGMVTDGEFFYKVLEGDHCKTNCSHEYNCIISDGKWIGSNLENNSYCSGLFQPTVEEVRKNIAHEYYIPLDRCSPGLLTCYEIIEI